FLTSRGIECNNLQELSIKDQLLINENVDKIVGSAISHHFQHNHPPKNVKIVLPIESLKHGLSMAQSIQNENIALKDVITDNEHEKRILSNVISPNETGVTFEKIGALDNVKETLRELVILPLQRPELFSKGQLRKPVKGILLFGPPGTGKTMLAKAVATEAGANFINISVASITSMVDSSLGRRGNSTEHEERRKMKNEFMVNWDGLRTKELERIIVLGATNRPFDLDDAVIRRFPRRLMVGLPDELNREKILEAILSKEILSPDVDLKLVANMTEGYSGSDLKNLCLTVAFSPIREIMEREKKEKSLAITEGRPEPPLYGSEDIRPLGMDDFKSALNQVCASSSRYSSTMNELEEWNNMFGDGGSRQKESLSYFC
ncbi:hypothetical protein U9M48_036933, partial [Paspalum notatum var. saurae]